MDLTFWISDFRFGIENAKLLDGEWGSVRMWNAEFGMENAKGWEEHPIIPCAKARPISAAALQPYKEGGTKGYTTMVDCHRVFEQHG